MRAVLPIHIAIDGALRARRGIHPPARSLSLPLRIALAATIRLGRLAYRTWGFSHDDFADRKVRPAYRTPWLPYHRTGYPANVGCP